ncbi:MAG: DUF2808 domain-containing protein [Cyanobacteria bacterium P01_H01_bin.119]
MSAKFLFSIGSSLVILSAAYGGSPAVAVELLNGETAFVQQPRLLSTTTTRDRASARNPVYQFVLTLPEGAGEPLGRVTITPRNPRSARWRFRLERSQAYSRTPAGQSVELLASAQQDPETAAITVEFAEPISPGQQVIITLHPSRNPRRGGEYLFGIEAAPAAARPQSYFVGYGRIRIYEVDNDPFIGFD